MKYCLVENGRIVEGPCFLPTVWKNISGLPNLPAEELVKHGWVPFEVNENTDEANFKQLKTTIEITETKVIQHNEFVERTAEEKAEYQAHLKETQ